MVDDDVYIGSTVQPLCKIMVNHRCDAKREGMCRKLYNKMSEYGFDNFYIELVEEWPCENIEQLHQREGYYIRLIGTLTGKISGRSRKEYDLENAEEYQTWRDDHKEK